mmetsp:Transcript_30231/g.70615  ORF Transcript_30231/g.70615 Transcript_30231/m.70615 type:complete len:232 (-) Transcript_30231:223-918(-)
MLRHEQDALQHSPPRLIQNPLFVPRRDQPHEKRHKNLLIARSAFGLVVHNGFCSDTCHDDDAVPVDRSPGDLVVAHLARQVIVKKNGSRLALQASARRVPRTEEKALDGASQEVGDEKVASLVLNNLALVLRKQQPVYALEHSTRNQHPVGKKGCSSQRNDDHRVKAQLLRHQILCRAHSKSRSLPRKLASPWGERLEFEASGTLQCLHVNLLCLARKVLGSRGGAPKPAE